MPSIPTYKSRTKMSSYIVARPLCFFVLLMSGVLFVPAGLLMPFWMNKVDRIKAEVKLISHDINEGLLSGTENTAKLFAPLNSSTINFVRVLSASLHDTQLSFGKIKSRVAPSLFLAISTIPHLSQISYIGSDGLFFAYYLKGNQPMALYSNSTFPEPQNVTTNYTWYTRPADRDTGKLYGEEIKTSPVMNTGSWFQETLKNNKGYASIGNGWDSSQDPLILSTMGMDGRGAISLGFPVKSLIDCLTDATFYNGALYLGMKDGTPLVQGIPNTKMILFGNTVSIQLLNPNGDQVGNAGNATCQTNNSTSRAPVLSIWNKKYEIYCSPLEVAGLESVYVLALPHNELPSLIDTNIKFAFVLLVLMICSMVAATFIFVLLTVRGKVREVRLCHALIEQKQATQQAEKKSMNRSRAIYVASHDVRNALGGITGLIDICCCEVALGSELHTNLVQMEARAKDLLGILNSILDTSKIEAGKMELEEVEFDVEQLLEGIVDLCHLNGMKKGIDVILDPCDGSISKFSSIRGDRYKLDRILSNLINNAVKFTSEGHVSVRAWARKPSFENEILPENLDNSSCLSCLFSHIDKVYNDMEAANSIQRDPNCMEYIFEVNDTGKGIPKEKQQSVFEDFVQVKETTSGQGGTGLGLGIIQSLVRLMGGEIKIVDKDIGEKGTCFKFNTFFTTCETNIQGDDRGDDIEAHAGHMSSDSHQNLGKIARIRSFKAEGSHVILCINGDERSKIVKKFMERLGIKVSIVKQHGQLPRTLKRIKPTLSLSRSNSSGKSDMNSRSDGISKPMSRASSDRSKDTPLSAMDGADNVFQCQRKSNILSFILLVIDTSIAPFRDVSRAVAEFRRDLNNHCSSKVVWLDKPGSNNISLQGLDQDKLPLTDLIISKPLHGSRLHQVVRILPEFGGRISQTPPQGVETTYNVGKSLPESSTRGKISMPSLRSQIGEIEEIDDDRRPLSGKNILIADDDPIGRKIATFVVSQLGANVFTCQNGKEAVDLVRTGLNDQQKYGASKILPFDHILMDCEMPVMNGFEATRCIRKVEKNYGIYIQIIALTAHGKGEEVNMMIHAGVDDYLTKPLNRELLLNSIFSLQRNVARD